MSAVTPTEWMKHNRDKSIILAKKIQAKLQGKVLKQVDHKTWVYVNPGEQPKPIVSTVQVIKFDKDVTKQHNMKAVIIDGVEYESVKQAAEKLNYNRTHVQRMLTGAKKNTIGIKYVHEKRKLTTTQRDAVKSAPEKIPKLTRAHEICKDTE